MANKVGRPASDVFKRFASKVKVVDSGCHEWQSTLSKHGYGKFYFKGKQEPAHRVSYLLNIGDLDDKWVLHKCDNRKCVNPEHLFLGTSQDNISDMDNKNRRGTKCKITLQQAEEIKQMYARRISQREIGEKFGVHQTIISRVILNRIKLLKV